MIESSELDLTSVDYDTTKNIMKSENVFKWVILRVLLPGTHWILLHCAHPLYPATTITQNEDTVAWLTPHAAVAREDGGVVYSWGQLDASCRSRDESASATRPCHPNNTPDYVPLNTRRWRSSSNTPFVKNTWPIQVIEGSYTLI
jgi:hypothetical protein